jgi:hypothetical protein
MRNATLSVRTRMQCENPIACFLFVCLMLIGLLPAGTAWAAKPRKTVETESRVGTDDADRSPAKQAYEEGLRAYNLGKWDEAIQGFEKSYKLSGDATLLFNVGQAQRQAGRPKEATIAYRAYLREFPDSPQREMIEGKLREMEASAPKSSSLSPAPVATTNPTPPQADTPPPGLNVSSATKQDSAQPSGTRWWLWTTVGAVVVAGIVTAVVLSTGGTVRDTSCPAGLGACLVTGK